LRPVFKRGHQRVLRQFFGHAEVAHTPRHGSDDVC